MENLLQLWNEWEIHLLVLLSFTLQTFLFFAGGLRPRNTNTFVRLSVWFAYLGADFVAVYALGFLSRQQDNTTGGRESTLGKNHQLAFFWAPFLIIHLGGQDTITAFAIEDNNLWLRHLLNLTVHVMLASYVFWKSTGWHNFHLLVPGIFLFVSGIIKYGERTYALKCGSLKNTEGLPARGNEMQPQLNRDDKYATLIGFALRSAPVVRNFFAGCNLVQFMATNVDYMCMFGELDERQMLLKIEIGMIYDDLYCKAMVLRKRICVIFRCLSQVCAVVAFVLFTVSSKHRYSGADIVVTYVLFIGGFLVELCAVAVFISSPWTWGWLESRKCHKLAGMCWFLLSNNIKRLEKRMLWPNSMGQYNILNYVGLEQSWLSRHLKMLVRVTANMFGAGKERLLWISMLLDSKTIQVDHEIMQIVTLYADGVHTEFVSNGSGSRPHHQLWPNLHPVLGKLQLLSMHDFGLVIVFMHALTEVHLCTYNDPPSNMDATLVDTCRKLSKCMLYLLVTHPEMLPVTGSVETTLEYFVAKATEYGEGGKDDAILQGTRKLLEDLMDLQAIQPSEETLQEIRDFWLRLLLYAAGKSRGETHAAQLAVGGELLTYAWLLMAHLEMGDSWPRKIELGDATAGTMMPDIAYVFPKKSEDHRT
jgi:hypothetical protein